MLFFCAWSNGQLGGLSGTSPGNRVSFIEHFRWMDGMVDTRRSVEIYLSTLVLFDQLSLWVCSMPLSRKHLLREMMNARASSPPFLCAPLVIVLVSYLLMENLFPLLIIHHSILNLV